MVLVLVLDCWWYLIYQQNDVMAFVTWQLEMLGTEDLCPPTPGPQLRPHRRRVKKISATSARLTMKLKIIDGYGVNIIKPLPCPPRRSFSSIKFFKGDNGKLLRVMSAFPDANYNFTRITPRERRPVRQPIIINGAGPAGLILAIGLQNARIPFEICETHRHDLHSRPRRNHVSILSSELLRPLREILRFPSYKSFLKEIALNPPATGVKARRHDYSINTEVLMQLLRRQVRVNYGFRLEHEGISCLESVITSRYLVGETIRTFEGSLLVGADGIFSAGRANHVTQSLD